MKRYGLKWDNRNQCGCHMEDADKADYGNYYAVEDVDRAMIPRPSEEDVRKAVDELNHIANVYGDGSDRYAQARAALLRLMGGKVK